MPRPGRNPETNGKYCSVFFRPWTLLSGQGSVMIPELQHLGIRHTHLQVLYAQQPLFKRRRLRSRQHDRSRFMSTKEAIRWHDAWSEYIRGHVVSRHSARLIQSFLATTMARAPEDDSASDDNDASDIDDEIPHLRLSGDDVRSIMRSKFEGEVTEEWCGSEVPASGDPARKKARTTKLHGLFQRATRRGAAVWSTPALKGPADSRQDDGRMATQELREKVGERERG